MGVIRRIRLDARESPAISFPMMELRCSRDLALRLGAIGPETIAHHKAMRDRGDLLVRDTVTSWPMFWAWQATREDAGDGKSS